MGPVQKNQSTSGFVFIKNWSHIAKEFPGALDAAPKTHVLAGSL
jgi:hypothetical protein